MEEMAKLFTVWTKSCPSAAVDVASIPGALEKIKTIAASFEAEKPIEEGSEEFCNCINSITDTAKKFLKEYVIKNLTETAVIGLAAIENSNFGYHKSIAFYPSIADWEIADVLEEWDSKNPGIIEKRYDDDGIAIWCKYNEPRVDGTQSSSSWMEVDDSSGEDIGYGLKIGMKIHCSTEDEFKSLYKWLINHGFKHKNICSLWYDYSNIPTISTFRIHGENTVFQIVRLVNGELSLRYGDLANCEDETVVAFSDLVM